jgi:thiol-disulfide isomerase/thioredoxin
MHRLICFIASAALLGAAGTLVADDHNNGTETDTQTVGQVAESEPKRLMIADPAPELEVAHWLKGDAIEAFEPGNVYVIEFWATWCGPCLAAMPHVSAVQDQYRDYGVTVVGVSDEPLQTIVEFLTSERNEGELWYHAIRFTLATDPERRPHVEYMRAASQRTIPTAFIIGKGGKVEWIGHPMHMDEPLDKIVHDRWDRDAFREEFIAKHDHERQVMELMLKMREHRAEGEWHNVLATLDALIELEPSPFYQVERFMTLLRDMNEPEQLITRKRVEFSCFGKKFAVGDADAHDGRQSERPRPQARRRRLRVLRKDLCRTYAADRIQADRIRTPGARKVPRSHGCHHSGRAQQLAFNGSTKIRAASSGTGHGRRVAEGPGADIRDPEEKERGQSAARQSRWDTAATESPIKLR